MKTLILNGSPRPRGDTSVMIRTLTAALPGEVKIVDAYRIDIRPCTDCRYCLRAQGCAITDGMEALLADIADADCIVIASPVYFSSLTGPLLSLMSRLQIVYTAKAHHGIDLIQKPKRGVLLLAAGGSGSPEPAKKTGELLLRVMKADPIATVCSPKTDLLPAEKDEKTLSALRLVAGTLAERVQ